MKFLYHFSKMPLWVGFLVISVPVILFFIFTTPLGWGLDEQVHASRVYQISQGNFYPDFSGGVAGGNISVNYQTAFGVGWEQSNKVDRAQHPYSRSDVNLEPQAQLLADMPLGKKEKFYDFGATGPYTPLVYIPSSIGVKLGSIFDFSVGHTSALARGIQASIYLLLASFALYITRSLKLRWLVFSLALLPSSLYQASILSADAITIGLSLLFSAAMLRIFITTNLLTLKWMVILIALVTSLALIKQSYALLALLILFIPVSRFDSRNVMIRFKTIAFSIWLVILVIASSIGLSYSDAIAAYRGELATDISVAKQILWVISNPILFAGIFMKTLAIHGGPWYASFIGTFGYTTIPVPFMATLVLFAILIISALYAEKTSDKKSAYYIFTVGIISSLSVIMLLYVTFNTVGATEIAGVQGRYFVPCALFSLYGAAKLFNIRVIISDEIIKLIVVVGVVMSLLATVVTYFISLF